MTQKTRTRFLAVLAQLTAFAFFSGCSPGDDGPVQDPQKRYNVVMIVSDALRQDVVGCYGGRAQTPYINWLAANGVVFENAYSTSPWTSPSAVSMFSGNYATSYEYTTDALSKNHPAAHVEEKVYIPEIYVPHSEELFVETLKKFGYTAGMQPENVNITLHNVLQGLDSIPQTKPSQELADSINAITGGELFRSWRESPAYWDSFCILRYLLGVDPGQNFFVLHWLLDPHSPYDPAEKFASRIAVDESRLRAPRHFYSKTKYDRAACSAVEQKFFRDLYVAEVESVDERVGFILKVLSHKNLLNKTYLVFTSDHGEQFGAHGLFEHGGHGLGCHYYEGLMRVPLIIAGPGIPKNKRVTDYVSLLDMMPTLKELLGVQYKESMQGTSLGPLMFGDAKRSGYLYFDDVQQHDQIDALLENNYKLISLKNGKFELYEIDTDPQEKIDFSGRLPELVESMFEKIKMKRNENNERRKNNRAAIGNNMDQMSEEERRKTIEKLRSLGYVE